MAGRQLSEAQREAADRDRRETVEQLHQQLTDHIANLDDKATWERWLNMASRLHRYSIVREALWGYAHYGQFSELGWRYVDGGSRPLDDAGSVVTLAADSGEYSVVIETKGAASPQVLRFRVGAGLSQSDLCVWRSTESTQFERLPDIAVVEGAFTITAEPNVVYSLSTTRGQRKGQFTPIPEDQPFPLPYRDSFHRSAPDRHGRLPRYTADISGAFELAPRPDSDQVCLRQLAPIPTISWAPDWHPYTIIGDREWTDYEVSVDMWLGDGEVAGVLGRVNHVGTGYGFVPECYLAELSADGTCRLAAVRGKQNKQELVGDAEQQALIQARADDREGGEIELGSVKLNAVGVSRWHRLALRCEGARLSVLVDGQVALTREDRLYARGQVGLLARGPEIPDATELASRSAAATGRLSQPYFRDLCVAATTGATASNMPRSSRPLY